MSDARIIRFPTGQAEITEPDSRPRSEAPSFDDWCYTEVVDFMSAVAALDELFGHEEEFWTEIARLREQIDSWHR